MKKMVLSCLLVFAALLAACGGSEQEAEQQAMQSQAESEIVEEMVFDNVSEAEDYLLAHYSEDQMKEMYVEFTALNRADSELYYEKDESGEYVEMDEEAMNEILEKMNQHIDAVIGRYGINRALYAALMMYARTTDWPTTLEEQIATRAAAINAEREAEIEDERSEG